MDVDFDNDLLYENDRVKRFLLEKLQGIQHSNKRVEEMIEKRKHIFSFASENYTLTEENNMKVSLLGLKIFNNKCTFVFNFQNSSKKSLNIHKVFLDWDCPAPLNFKTHFVRNEDLNSENCRTKTVDTSKGLEIVYNSYIVIVLDKPQFVNNLSYTVRGNIFGKQNKTDIIVSLPDMKITSSDIVNKKLNEPLLQRADISDLLAVMFGSIKTEFIMILPETSTANFNSIFEIHCSLTAVNIPEVNKIYFTACRICPAFDNSLMEMKSLSNKHFLSVTFYTKNDESLVALLHYFHQNIMGVVIIPKHCQNYDIDKISGNVVDQKKELENFKSNFEAEIGTVNSYTQYLDSSRKDCDLCMHLRKNMFDAEKNTDLSYLRISSGTV